MNNELTTFQRELPLGFYQTKFLFVHDDCFGRGFKNKEDITNAINESNNNYITIFYNIDPISKEKSNDDSERINVFVLSIVSRKLFDSAEDFFDFCNIEKLYGFTNLTDVYYYECILNDFNLIKE